MSKNRKILVIFLIAFGVLFLPAYPIFGIFLIILGICLRGRKKKKEAQTQAPIPATPQESTPTPVKKTAKPDGIPSRKARGQFTCRVAGVTYKCRLIKDGTDRQDILAKLHKGQILSISPYKYQGKPAYYIVDPESGYDIGNLPADVSAKVSSFEDPTVEAYVVEIDGFYPRKKRYDRYDDDFDDDDDDFDDDEYEDNFIYYCKIKGYIL